MKFKMVDENFVCENCGRNIEKLKYTARDHCNHCLYSKHLDIYPGDRLAECKGLMQPIGYVVKKKGETILYRCRKCGYEHTNIVAEDDNRDEIIRLSTKQY